MEKAADVLLAIDAPHFYAGVVLEERAQHWVVVRAAPIVRYMTGWNRERVIAYAARKNWMVVLVNQP